MRFALLWGVVSVGLWLAALPRAYAQGFDSNVLRPAPVGRGTVTMAETHTLPAWDADAALVLGYAQHPVELENAAGDRVDGIVDRLTTLDLRVDVGLPQRFEAGLTMPIALNAGFAPTYAAGRSSASGGDLGAEVRWNVLAPKPGQVLGLTPMLSFTFPTGSSHNLTGSDALTITPSLTADARVDRFRFAAQAGAQLRTSEAQFEYGRVRQQVLYGLSAESGIDAARRFVLSVELIGRIDTAGELGPTELLGAARYAHGALGLLLATGAGLNDGIGAPDFRVLAGASLRLQRSGDADDDGIPDTRDGCPQVAEDRDGYKDEDGCPEGDNDGDGVADVADHCPLLAEDRDGIEDADGCPDGDNDGDGVPDQNDACPGQAEDADGFQDGDGCPEADNDGDGIADVSDKCPMQPETANGFEDQDGCPDEAPRYIFRAHERLVFNNIEFQTDSDALLDSSKPVLDEVVKSLVAQPTVRVRIEGHTDDRGPDDRNLTLSQRRALAVMNYLIKAGIDERRVEYTGFGETRPVDDNKTDAGRAKNRRVAFLTLDP